MSRRGGDAHADLEREHIVSSYDPGVSTSETWAALRKSLSPKTARTWLMNGSDNAETVDPRSAAILSLSIFINKKRKRVLFLIPLKKNTD